jgi:hypothetical protein
MGGGQPLAQLDGVVDTLLCSGTKHPYEQGGGNSATGPGRGGLRWRRPFGKDACSIPYSATLRSEQGEQGRMRWEAHIKLACGRYTRRDRFVYQAD